MRMAVRKPRGPGPEPGAGRQSRARRGGPQLDIDAVDPAGLGGLDPVVGVVALPGGCAGGVGVPADRRWQPWASGAAGSLAPSKTNALSLARACPRESVRVELSQSGPRGGRDGTEYLVEAGRPPTARHAVARENRL